MQVNDVGPLEFVHSSDVSARIGDIDLENAIFFQSVGLPDDAALPQEFGFKFPRLGNICHFGRIGLAVTHEHARLDTVVVQGMQQAVGSNCSPTRSLSSIDNQYPHGEDYNVKSTF